MFQIFSLFVGILSVISLLAGICIYQLNDSRPLHVSVVTPETVLLIDSGSLSAKN